MHRHLLVGLGYFGFLLFLIVSITSAYSSVVYAQATGPGLPCDLNKLGFTPALALHGENHKNENSGLSRMLDTLEASNGRFFLGLEGYLYEDSTELNKFLEMLDLKKDSARIFGFDSGFTHGIGSLYSLYVSVTTGMVDRLKNAKPEGELRRKMNELAGILYFQYNANPYLREALSLIPRNYSANPIAKLIIESNALETVNIYSNAAILPSLAENHFRVFLSSMALSYSMMAVGPKYSRSMGTPSDLLELTTMILTGSNVLGPIQRVAVDWRNLQIVRNMAQIYCRAAQEKKNVVLVMGSLHVPGIKQMFERLTARKAVITVLDTTVPRTDLPRRTLTGITSLPSP